MPGAGYYDNESFTFTQGLTGSFSFYGAPSGSSVSPAFASGPGALMGTINGQQITGLSSYGNPNNTALNPGNNATSQYPDLNGIHSDSRDTHDTNSPNGFSFNLADGSSIHIYIYDVDGLGHYRLQYQTTAGQSGTFQVSYNESQVYYDPNACFAAGTLIRTPSGEVAVEALREGNLALTQAGEARPVRWLGHTIVHPRRSPEPWNLHPIRVCAGAIAEGTPCRDLFVSPGHALLIGDVLMNAGLLVNGGTIVQEEVERVDYYHVELDSHDILIADGMPCESYLDDGNRASFLNGADHIRLHGRIDSTSEATCRPLVKDGPLLVEARARLLDRARDLGWRLEEQPDLRLRLGDAALAPVAVAGRRWWFLLPEDAPSPVRLRSAAAIVNRIAPELADDRLLGVAIGALRIDGEAVPLDGDVFGAGFLAAEDDGTTAWRWTDGDAALHLPAGARMIEVTLQIVLPTLWLPDVCEGTQQLSASQP